MSREKESIIGKKFNKLTAIERIYDDSRCVKYLFKCDCGKEKIIIKHSVVNGITKSCGCVSTEKTKERCFKNLSGQKFGRLTAISPHHKTRLGTYWNCKCDCGNECIVLTSKLSNGHTISCGCRKEETKIELSEVNKTHDLSNSRIYRIYNGMISRCYKKYSNSYVRYGGRGIKVCDDWHDFWCFVKWSDSVGGKPKGYTLDRINNDGNYEPSNCRWADWRTQKTNTSANVFLEYNGVKKTMIEWCEELHVHPHTLQNRIKRGWPVERALTEKVTENSHYSRHKILVQCDLNGIIIKKYNSLSEVKTQFNPKSVSNAICKKQTYKGYIWKYEDE